MEDLISVVIPIYKVEPFLLRCVQSIVDQNYRNIEIILVDDGSPDRCGEMCDELAEKDSRIKVYHKENGGLSDARNFGVERSSGKYITFVDSDDYVAVNYIEYLHTLLTENGADISGCPMCKTSGDTAQYRTEEKMPDVHLLTGIQACHQMFGALYMVLVTAWGKLYKSEIVKQNPFPKGRVHEDEATTCKYYYMSKKVALGNRCLYAYYQNPDSITRSDSAIMKPDRIWALSQKAYFFEERKEPQLAIKAWDVYFTVCANDSLKYGGRSDIYLKDFPKGRTLGKKLLFKYCLYSMSKPLYKRLINRTKNK